MEHCEGEGKDHISKLPEDILLMLLSPLEMKELARLSIVSKGWRYLWTNTVDLNFDPSIILPEYDSGFSPTPTEETKYFNWLDHVIRLHSGHSINKLRVQFVQSTSVAPHVDRCVKFALSKRVKHLELIIPAFTSLDGYSLGFDSVKPSAGHLKYLTHLHLSNVRVTGEFVEFLLSERSGLEQLFMLHSTCELKMLKVTCSKLKQLTIIGGFSFVDEIEIDALNLSYFEYVGHENVDFKRVPALVEVHLSGHCCAPSVPICQKIAPFAMQLSRLSLDVDTDLKTLVDHELGMTVIVNIPAESLPCFSNLKCLELKCNYDDAMIDFPSTARFLRACPLLREFKMEVVIIHHNFLEEEAMVLQGLEPLPFMNWGGRYLYQDYVVDEAAITEYKGDDKAFPSLRVFEYVGFVGFEMDVNLILYVLNLATQLETFICRGLLEPEFISEDLASVCKNRAHKLGQFVPPNVKYVIRSSTYSDYSEPSKARRGSTH